MSGAHISNQRASHVEANACRTLPPYFCVLVLPQCKGPCPPSANQGTQAARQSKKPVVSKLYMWQKLTLTHLSLWNMQYHGKFRGICREMSKINISLLMYSSLLVDPAFLSPYLCIQTQIWAQIMEKACESLVY